MVEKWFFYHTWTSRSVITRCHLIVNGKLQPNILWLASLPTFLAKDLFFVIDLLLRRFKTYKPYCSCYGTIPFTCFSMLAIYFLISFPLIAIFFFLDQSNIPIIFINKEMKLQYLNIELRDFDIWTLWFWFSWMVRYNVWIFHSRLSLSREWLVKFNLTKTLQIPTCASYVACFTSWHSRASRDILIFTESSPNSRAQPLH